MVHGRDILFFWFLLQINRIQILRSGGMFRDLFQGIDILVIYAAVEGVIKGLHHHYLCAFAIVYLEPPFIKHTVMGMLKLDAMSAVHRSFIQNSQDQVDFFVFRLYFKHGSDTMDRQGKFCIEFFYVGV